MLSAGCCCTALIGPDWWQPSALLGRLGGQHRVAGSAFDRAIWRDLHAAAIFHLPGLPAARDALERDFGVQVATQLNMYFGLTEAAKPQRVAIMASKDDHCLLDLLWRNRRGELNMTVAMVIANHPDLAHQVRRFGVPFLHVPATTDIGHKQSNTNSTCCATTSIWSYWPLHADHHAPFLAAVGCP
jgi:formyltetrahydrofolate deformylase